MRMRFDFVTGFDFWWNWSGLEKFEDSNESYS